MDYEEARQEIRKGFDCHYTNEEIESATDTFLQKIGDLHFPAHTNRKQEAAQLLLQTAPNDWADLLGEETVLGYSFKGAHNDYGYDFPPGTRQWDQGPNGQDCFEMFLLPWGDIYQDIHREDGTQEWSIWKKTAGGPI